MKLTWQQLTGLIGSLIFLSLLQSAFISSLSYPVNQFNLILASLIFIVFFFDFRLALLASLVAGFFLGALSFNFFGLQLIAFFLAVCLAKWVLTNWLTNRSIYSLLALGLMMTLFYGLFTNFVLYLSVVSLPKLFLGQASFWAALAYQGLANSLFLLLTFQLMIIISRRFNPFFLDKSLIN
ncbi:MAG: hypothetical protein ACOX0C_01725 [Patescibacteria group bacterium]|jgi:hypothetical protein